MTTLVSDEAEVKATGSGESPIVNDFVIKVASVNGSGSLSAKMVLMRAIFGMGVPVSGKNLVPSNIEGLPTWFTVRASEAGWLASRNKVDILVAMNPATVVEDIAKLDPGATLIVRKRFKHYITRDDLRAYVVPFTDLAKAACPDARIRKKVVNVIYVGVVGSLVGLDLDVIKTAIGRQFAGKEKAIEINQAAAVAGYTWAQENITDQPTHVVSRSNAVKDKVLIDGNEAAALGALFGGVTFLSWYPITPSSSLCETLIRMLGKHRHDAETGKATYAVVQAEDEIASLATVLGASWAGARAMTATSGPGISLMAELTGLAYFAEIPAVIADVQRMGPSTGLPTRTSQGDISKAYNLSHGDCKHVLLIPGNVKECYEFTVEALNLADQLQTPIFLMSDLDIGMNKWMSDPFEPPTEPIKRGKVLTAEDLEKGIEFARYRDVDGDGIPYRTLPGTNHPKAAYFTRGTGHDETANYTENSEAWRENIDRIGRKFDTAREMVPKPVIDAPAGANLGIIAFGSSDPAVEEARHLLRERHGLETAYMRLRALPINGQVSEFIGCYPEIFVVEQNRDGQMASILRSELPTHAQELKSILHYNGLSIDAETIVEQLCALHNEEQER